MTKPAIAYENLPPNWSWLIFMWMLALTVKVYDLDVGWYYAIGTYTLILFIGFLVTVKKTQFIDLFKPLKDRE